MRLALTTNADNIVGTDKNDTVNGYAGLATTITSTTTTSSSNTSDTTFQVVDTINGNGGVNTLNLTVSGATTYTNANAGTYSILPAANVSNIQVFNVRDVASIANNGGGSLSRVRFQPVCG